MSLIMMVMARPDQESAAGLMPQNKETEKLFADMGKYHEELAKAGVLLDANGLKSTANGWRIKYAGGKRTVTDGPFSEAKELIAGYTVIQVKSREEAMEWARRFPAPFGDAQDGEIEVRQLYEPEDFEPR